MANTVFACSSNSAIYPLTAAGDFLTVTVDVAVNAAACPGPRVNSASLTQAAVGDVPAANNAASASTSITCDADLVADKTNSVNSLVSGETTDYVITFSNLGPASADGAVVTDVPDGGLSSCSVTQCTGNGGASCPLAAAWPNLLTTGIALTPLPSGGSVAFTLSCTVSATGL
jgi:uncharacterized repeat protein (TIGR01451 family)